MLLSLNRLKIERYAVSSWDNNPWSNFCDPHWELICHNKSKMPSIHYMCFSLKISFVNGDKFAGICGLVQIDKWNSKYKRKHYTLWSVCFVKSYMVDDNLVLRAFHLWNETSSRYKQHTFPTIQDKERKVSWIQG